MGGECAKCGATRTDQQLGLEPTPDQFVAAIVAVFREVRRVLAPHGTCWVNLGDSYHGGGYANHAVNGPEWLEAHGGDRRRSRQQDRINANPELKPKDLVGVPWSVAFALRADGWYLRSDVIWAKKNCMPESVTDRPTKAHEYVFLLTKRPRYWFDQEAVAERAQTPPGATWEERKAAGATAGNVIVGHEQRNGTTQRVVHGDGSAGSNLTRQDGRRNVRSVWQIATQPYPEAHFACVDDQTQALTPLGWKRHDELTDGDLIAMYDPRLDECRFSRATFHRYDYDGDLVAIEKRDSSQRLTPNHRCLIRRRDGEPMVVLAEELKPGMDVLTYAPLRMEETLGVGREMAALLGWYVTEGSVHHDAYVSIYQSQSANPQHVRTIRELLVGVGATFNERTRTRPYRDRQSTEVSFNVTGGVARWLQASGKRLPLDALRLPEDELQVLLDALIDGDGHRRADGRTCIIQKDKESIDRMQMLALRLGYRAVISQRQDGGHVLHLTRGRWLTLRSTDGAHIPIGREPYTGIVWCPNVETGFWLARRRGRPFVTGNTFPEELARRCILAGCPQRVCRVCGKPSERIVERPTTPDELRRGYDRKGTVQHISGDKARGLGGGTHQAWLDANPPQTVGWSDCGCILVDDMERPENTHWRPGRVLDPFVGSGTVCKVARDHGRHAVGIDLNESYLELAARRLQQLSLLSEPA